MTCFSFGLCQPRLLTIGKKLFSDLFLFNLDRNKTQGQSRKNLVLLLFIKRQTNKSIFFRNNNNNFV
jgi:hypothetical protein